MFKEYSRNTKSQSMILSLYGLSLVAGIILTVFLFATLFHIGFNFGFKSVPEVIQNIFQAMGYIFLSLVLSLPFALAIVYNLVVRVTSPKAPLMYSLVNLLGQAPVLLFGGIFLFIVGPTLYGVIMTLSFISATQLILRWNQISRRVQYIEVESMQALGMSRWQILIHLYLKQHYKHYIYHCLAVVCYLSVLVTPLLCFEYYSGKPPYILTIDLYKNLGVNLHKTAVIAFFLLSIHGVKVWLDHKTSFWEIEYG